MPRKITFSFNEKSLETIERLTEQARILGGINSFHPGDNRWADFDPELFARSFAHWSKKESLIDESKEPLG